YRLKFDKDVVLDVVGFRRLGHNETDEPSYTQPLMYQRVKAHPGVRAIYAERLVKERTIDEAGVDELIAERIRRYEDAQARAKDFADSKNPTRPPGAVPMDVDGSARVDTAISAGVIKTISEQISVVPKNFNLNPKMVSQLARRAKMGDGAMPIDWAFAE